MISSTLNFKKWDAALMKSMGKTKNYVKKDGYYYKAETKLEKETAPYMPCIYPISESRSWKAE